MSSFLRDKARLIQSFAGEARRIQSFAGERISILVECLFHHHHHHQGQSNSSSSSSSGSVELFILIIIRVSRTHHPHHHQGQSNKQMGWMIYLMGEQLSINANQKEILLAISSQ